MNSNKLHTTRNNAFPSTTNQYKVILSLYFKEFKEFEVKDRDFCRVMSSWSRGHKFSNTLYSIQNNLLCAIDTITQCVLPLVAPQRAQLNPGLECIKSKWFVKVQLSSFGAAKGK